jgi:hypothetical protein
MGLEPPDAPAGGPRFGGGLRAGAGSGSAIFTSLDVGAAAAVWFSWLSMLVGSPILDS